MVFNSWTFLYFLLLVVPLYYVLQTRAQNAMLLVASYVFYGWWDWRFLSLLWISTIVDFVVARQMGSVEDRPARRRRLLYVSLATNLGILGIFKYANFFIQSTIDLANSLGVHVSPVLLHIVLPVGISFYTFQTLAYTIDVYRGKTQPTGDLLTFALYVAFFPQLVAGPIERAQHLLPLLSKPRTVRLPACISGLSLILVGLVRKVAVADFIAGTVTDTFNSPESYPSFRLLLGVYAFAIQIYGDFAGYSDIARGTSRLLGVELMVNFHRPYAASNITEFWRRWHISLSTWLRDYLYIPLGGNRFGTSKLYRNLMITMLLGGLWHGASWNFVIWGALHGAYLALHKVYCSLRGVSPKDRSRHGLFGFLKTLAGIVFTFHLVCLAWVFFRADTLGQSIEYISHFASFEMGMTMADYNALHRVLIAMIVLLAIDGPKALAEWKGASFESLSPLTQGLYVGLMLVFLLVMGDRVYVPFIYFQF